MKLFAAACAALAAAAACNRTVDHKEFEGTIAERVKSLGLAPGKIACPPNVEAKPKAEFTCKVDIETATYDLIVTIDSVENGRAQMTTRWAKGDAVLAKKLAAETSKPLGEELGMPVAVDCGSEPLLFLDHGKAKCKLSAGKTTATVLLSFDDKLVVKGYEVVPPLISRGKLEKALQPSIAQKTVPDIQVDCGPDDLIRRPDDGIVKCQISDAKQHATVRVTITPKLDVEHWETEANH